MTLTLEYDWDTVKTNQHTKGQRLSSFYLDTHTHTHTHTHQTKYFIWTTKVNGNYQRDVYF